MLMTMKEVAEALGCSLSNVYNLKDQGYLVVVCVGAGGAGLRVSSEELQRFLAERRQHPGKDALASAKKNNPAKKGQPFKNLDGEKLLAAWRQRGVVETD